MKKWNGTEEREESKKAEKDKVCEEWEDLSNKPTGVHSAYQKYL